MYSFDQIIRGVKHPQRVARELNRLCHTRGGRHRFNPDGTGIFELDWDTLIILDACRYDFFEQQADLPGSTSHRYSRASATYEFIPANFTGRTLYDTIYLGAISWYLRLENEINADVFKTVDLQSEKNDVEWANKPLQAPTPETVTRNALKMIEEYPDKRLIVHYLQPHHPFVGSFGREQFEQESTSLLDVVNNSNQTDDHLREAYRENLSLVLDEVEKLLNGLTGRTIVTADHGEMLGDRHDYVPVKDYGHHPGIFNDPTVKVPLHVYERGSRRRINTDPPERARVADEGQLDDRLRNLGYRV